jgi:hypothetical protein
VSIEEEAARILEQGADAWESGTISWVQGAFGSRDHGVCADGMCRLQILGGTIAPKYAYYIHAMQALGSRAYNDVIGWNDTPGRTKEEVIELFKQAAKDLRNQL